MSVETIDSISALKLLKFEAKSYAWIDVRSEGEFADERIDGFRNFPILSNAHRHQVGICYKEKGQQEAIALGLTLTEANKRKTVEGWKAAASKNSAIVSCWRGGLRSKFACEWMQDEQIDVIQLKSGYKGLRKELRSVLERKNSFLVIGGLTGSNKSGLLRQLPSGKVLDLEKYANHFGSAFGYHPVQEQPNQTNFENQLFFDLYFMNGRIFVEDESRMIGRLHVPLQIHQEMQVAPVVWVEAPVEERAATIYEKYIQHFLENESISNDTMKVFHLECLARIQRKLGDALYRELCGQVREAYQLQDSEAHAAWIKKLLLQYYDRQYEHSFARSGRRKVFSGSIDQCRQWLSASQQGELLEQPTQ